MLAKTNPDARGLFTPRPALSPAAAFSLIEVLFAVFILALGLLGLGAMIPVVIREQRQSADATMGVIVAKSAETYLQNRPDLNRFSDYDPASNKVRPMGWGVFESRPDWSIDYSWEPKPEKQKFKSEATGPDADEEVNVLFNVTTGRMRIQNESNATGTPCFIRVRDRLWPDASVGGVQPRFVWDVVPRRLPPVAGQPDQLQIAVFVRRLDPNIRVPSGFTLYQVLTQDPGLQEAQWRRPVSVEANTPPRRRRPTLDGTGHYAKPFMVAVEYDRDYPDRIQFVPDPLDTPDDELLKWQLFSRPGQKLVDNIGNVYTVMSEVSNPSGDPTLDRMVKIQPPAEPWIGDTEAPGNPPAPGAPFDEWAEYRRKCGTLREIMLTSQIPAAVTVFNVDAEDLSESPSGSGTGDVSP